MLKKFSLWRSILIATLLVLPVVGCGPSEREKILDDSSNGAEIPGLRYDGLYICQIDSNSGQTECQYLRFYPNHSVIMVTVSGYNAASDVEKWFSKEHAKQNEGVAVGKVIFQNYHLNFIAVSSVNTSDYDGKIATDGIDFQVDYHSHGSGHFFYTFYRFTANNPTDLQTNEGVARTQSANLGQDSGTIIKNVGLGKFQVNVPTEWTGFDPSEAASLRQQYAEQRQQIYQQYSGSADDAKTVDIAGFHIRNDAGAFIIVSFSVPEQANLISTLKSQIEQKMDWGVQNGYIRKYLGLVPIDDENFSGFYTKAIGKDGGIQVSGGLEHKKLKNTVIQLTLLCPQDWDEDKATNTLTTVLKSLALTSK